VLGSVAVGRGFAPQSDHVTGLIGRIGGGQLSPRSEILISSVTNSSSHMAWNLPFCINIGTPSIKKLRITSAAFKQQIPNMLQKTTGYALGDSYTACSCVDWEIRFHPLGEYFFIPCLANPQCARARCIWLPFIDFGDRRKNINKF
jgi:hypothetical protein